MIRRFRQAIGTATYPIAVKVITIYVAAQMYYLTGGVPGTILPFSSVVPLTILCVSYSILDLSFDQLRLVLRRGTPLISALVSAAKFLSPIYLSLSALGILLSVMYEGMSYWSLSLFFIPLMVTRTTFKSYLDIRNVYRKTVEALANAIEAQNPKRHGHGRRVAGYAVDIAKELGIYGRELELIGYAAVLHDIGMLGVDEDSLDQLLEQVSSRSGDAPHAIIGAEVVEQVDFLFDAADMIRKHDVPYDRIRRQDDVKIGARIINVASHFDKLTRGEVPGERLTYLQALSRIKKEQGIMFDPRVVRAFSNVLR
ncbi:MAG: HD domain-containing protein, partial [Rubrobacteridae bacterium]|nr:HD domain-containing protein [Rubrobacteridae bacterium]